MNTWVWMRLPSWLRSSLSGCCGACCARVGRARCRIALARSTTASWRRPAVAGRPNASLRSVRSVTTSSSFGRCRTMRVSVTSRSGRRRRRGCRRSDGSGVGGGRPGSTRHEGSWLSGRRLRAAGGRHLRRAPGARRAVPHRERHRPRCERESVNRDLRHSVRHYRALFVELLEVGDDDQGGNVDDAREGARVSRLR